MEGWLGGLVVRQQGGGGLWGWGGGKGGGGVRELYKRFRRRVGELEVWGGRGGGEGEGGEEWVREYLEFCYGVYYLMMGNSQEALLFRKMEEVQGVVWTEIFRFFEVVLKGGEEEGEGEGKEGGKEEKKNGKKGRRKDKSKNSSSSSSSQSQSQSQSQPQSQPQPQPQPINPTAIRQMFSLSLSLEALTPPSPERAPELSRIRHHFFHHHYPQKEGKLLSISSLFHLGRLSKGEAVEGLKEIMKEILEEDISFELISCFLDILEECVGGEERRRGEREGTGEERGRKEEERERGGGRRRGRRGVKLKAPNRKLVERLREVARGEGGEEVVGVLVGCLYSIELCLLGLSPFTGEEIKREGREEEEEEEEEESENTSFVDLSSSRDLDSEDEGEEIFDEGWGGGEGGNTPIHSSPMRGGGKGGEILEFTKRIGEKDNQGTVERMALLFHLYPLLSIFHDKKYRVAYILGKVGRGGGWISNRMVEKILFEGLVIMDMRGGRLGGALPLLFSDIGVLILYEYCDVLLRLEKFSYAVVGGRVCGEVLKRQRQGQKYIQTLSKFALVAAERVDRKKAILIYRDILEYYVVQKKTNEVCVHSTVTLIKKYSNSITPSPFIRLYLSQKL